MRGIFNSMATITAYHTPIEALKIIRDDSNTFIKILRDYSNGYVDKITDSLYKLHMSNLQKQLLECTDGTTHDVLIKLKMAILDFTKSQTQINYHILDIKDNMLKLYECNNGETYNRIFH